MILRNGKRYLNNKPFTRISTTYSAIPPSYVNSNHTYNTRHNSNPNLQMISTKNKPSNNIIGRTFNNSYRGYPKISSCGASK